MSITPIASTSLAHILASVFATTFASKIAGDFAFRVSSPTTLFYWAFLCFVLPPAVKVEGKIESKIEGKIGGKIDGLLYAKQMRDIDPDNASQSARAS